MAITTLDDIVAGAKAPVPFHKVGATMEAAGVLTSLFYATGNPGAAVAPSPGINGAALTTYSGQLPWTNPGAGNSYLSGFEMFAATATGSLLLMDRLWHNSGIVVTTTTAQAITSGAMPARDRNGATSGDGLQVAIEVSTATTNAGAVTNTTLNYTNQSGTAGRTATMASFPATAIAGTFVPFLLAAGDTGVQSIQGVTLGTSYAAGAIHLVVYRQLASVTIPVANLGARTDAITGNFPRLYDNTVPFLVWYPTATAAVTVYGTLNIAQG